MDYAGAAGSPGRRPPDPFQDFTVPPGDLEKLGLEFQMSDLDNKVDTEVLITEMHTNLTKVVHEDDVLGIEFHPSKRSPQKCTIVFASELAKDKIRIQGLSIFRKNVTFSKPGQGVVKVEINGASLLLPNDILKRWLADQVGGMSNIVQFRHDHYFVNGQKRKWVSGTRYAYVKNLVKPLPPVAKIKRANGKEVTVHIWHFGQTHMRCRFCYQVVLKGHECPRKQPRQGCYRCGSLAHMARDCVDDNFVKCQRCHSTGHSTGDCTIRVMADGMGGRKETVTGKQTNPSLFSPRSPRRKDDFVIPQLIDKALAEKEMKEKAEAKAKKDRKKAEEKAERERQNQAALAERDEQHRQAMIANQQNDEKSDEDEERKRRADAAANAAESRRAQSPETSAPKSDDLLNEATLDEDALGGASGEDEDSGDESDLENDEDEESVDEVTDGEEDMSGVIEQGDEGQVSGEGESQAASSSDEDGTKKKQIPADEESEESDNHELEETRFFEAYDDEDSIHHQTANLALIGGSNAPKIQLVSDEDLKVTTVTLWEGGANIVQGPAKVKELSPDARESLELVILHLGTCDFPCVGTSSVMSHYMDYRDTTSKVSELCPNAHIIMSGLFPQAGANRELANEQIRRFNDALKSVGDDENEPNLHFCDNWDHFVSEDGHVLSELYSDPHTSGVHVNDKGSEKLSSNLMKEVKKVYYWERLGVPLSPAF